MDDKTGEEHKRLVNRMRWRGFGPVSVAYSEENVGELTTRNDIEFWSDSYRRCQTSPLQQSNNNAARQTRKS